MKKKIITLSILSGLFTLGIIAEIILLIHFYNYNWVNGDIILPTKYINWPITILLFICLSSLLTALLININKVKKLKNNIKSPNTNKLNVNNITIKHNETIYTNINQPKKKLSKLMKTKIMFFILIGIITILAIIQTILITTIIFKFIAEALAVPTTLITIIAILKYFEIKNLEKH